MPGFLRFQRLNLFKGLFKIGHNLLFAAHDAGQPHGTAVGLHAKGFFHHGGIIGNDQHLRTFLHDVREQQEHAVTAFALHLGDFLLKTGLDLVEDGEVHHFQLTDAHLVAVHVEIFVVAEDQIVH